MTEKKRICGACAWWENNDPILGGGDLKDESVPGGCHYDPVEVDKWSDEWCRHWSETTGWGDFKPSPTQLEQQAAEILDIIEAGDSAMNVDAKLWLEEYKRQC